MLPLPRRVVLVSLWTLWFATRLQADGTGIDRLPDIPVGTTSVRLESIALVPSNILELSSAGDGSGRLFVVTGDGFVRILEGGAVHPTPFLFYPPYAPNRSLRGLAFHPEFAANGKLYVVAGETVPNPFTPDYTAPQVDTATAHDNVILEFQVDPGDPDLVDPTSQRELLRIHQPNNQHNVNDLVFGADGYLYIALGDGGETRSGIPFPYQLNAQDTDNPFGSILRIDVDAFGPGEEYGIPPDNPLADGAVPEIYAWGVRNPWRITVDRETGEIYTGVNGDFTIEWIVRVELGLNYGWPIREGSFLWDPVTGDASADPAPDPTLTPPLAEYDHHTTGVAFGSVIGGSVYRGHAIPALYGKYVWLDWLAGALGLMDLESHALELIALDPTGSQLTSSTANTIGEDDAGELFIGLSYGEIVKLVRTAPLASYERGDCNADGTVNLADAVCTLAVLFQAVANPCFDSLDANDDGNVGISDPVFVLAYLFSLGALPPDPFGHCGADPTADTLACDAFAGCP